MSNRVSQAGDDRAGVARSLLELSDIDLTGATDNDLLFRSGGEFIDTQGALTWDASIFKVTGSIEVANANGGQIINEPASATNPTLIPDKTDPDTGIGIAGADIVSLVAGGIQIAQAKEVVGANQFIIAPGVIQNAAATPSLAFGDGDTGFYESVNDVIQFAAGGANAFAFFATGIDSANSAGGRFGAGAASATVPTFIPNKSDSDTGIGSAAPDQLSLIAGGVQVANLTELAGVVQLVLPLQNNSSSPVFAFGDGDSGFMESVDDTFHAVIAGLTTFGFTATEFASANAGGPSIRNVVSSATVPGFAPNKGDLDTGIGTNGLDALSLIAGAVEGIRITETAGVITNTLNGFTELGGSAAPSIKMKKLTGTTGATEGAGATVAHGLTIGKILAVDVLVTNDFGSLIPPRFTDSAGNEYDIFVDSVNILLELHATSSESIVSDAFTVLITYEE